LSETSTTSEYASIPCAKGDLRERADRPPRCRPGSATSSSYRTSRVAPRADAPSERTRVLDLLPPETRELRSEEGCAHVA
jgi:hypothetical protein